MNFNVYVEDELGHSLENLAQKLQKSRNALVREALKEFIEKQTHSQWSETILAFQGFSEGITFESYRDDLLPVSDEGMFA
jgi:hypothetical protein